MDEFKDKIEFCFGELLRDSKELTESILTSLNGKPFYDIYKIGDKVVYFMEQKRCKNTDFELTLNPIVERTLERLNKEYNFIRFSGKFPVFEKKVE